MRTFEQIHEEVCNEDVNNQLTYREIAIASAKQFATEILDEVRMKVVYEADSRLNYIAKNLSVWELGDRVTIHLNVNELKKKINGQ